MPELNKLSFSSAAFKFTPQKIYKRLQILLDHSEVFNPVYGHMPQYTYKIPLFTAIKEREIIYFSFGLNMEPSVE